MSRSIIALTVFGILGTLASNAIAADCPNPTDTTTPASIVLTSPSGGPVIYNLKNEAKDGTSATLCWLSESDSQNGKDCSAASSPVTAPSPLAVGLCTDGTNDFSSTLSSVTKADLIVIQFTPAAAGEVTQVLRLEAKDKDSTDFVRMYRVVGRAGIPNYAADSRYKLWLYGGYTYLRTQSDFKDGYPELLARFETRLIDRPATEKRHPVLRLYGETGLTGTAIVNTSDGGQPTTTTAPRVRQSFQGGFGVGYGVTVPVTVQKASDTQAFTIMGIARLGILTIPGADADTTRTPPVAASPGKTAYNWMGGLRIENERGGNFEGAYFEVGTGESEQFSQKRVPRLRADGILPLTGGSNLFRFAARLQLDTTLPFSKKENNAPGGEIRLSMLFNMDLHELAKRFGGQG